MIELLRVDQRLLHGQVAVTWVNSLAVDAILVANDEVVTNEMSVMALKLAKPANVNLAIRNIADGIKLINDPRTRDLKILVVVQTIEDAYRIALETDQVKHVNIGGVRKSENSKLIQPATFINAQQAEVISSILTLPHVDEVEFRMVPSETRKSGKSVVEIFK